MKTMMRRTAFVLVILGLATACETTIDPQTGATSTQWTLPGTAANEASFNEQWRRCTQFASQSTCEREFGGRTPMPSAFTFGGGS